MAPIPRLDALQTHHRYSQIHPPRAPFQARHLPQSCRQISRKIPIRQRHQNPYRFPTHANRHADHPFALSTTHARCRCQTSQTPACRAIYPPIRAPNPRACSPSGGTPPRHEELIQKNIPISDLPRPNACRCSPTTICSPRATTPTDDDPSPTSCDRYPTVSATYSSCHCATISNHLRPTTNPSLEYTSCRPAN